MEHEGDGDTICNWSARNDPRKLGTVLKMLEIGGCAVTI